MAPPRLKEWAYAGFIIVLVSALIAHPSVGDGPETVVLVGRLPRPGRPVLPQLPHDCAFLSRPGFRTARPARPGWRQGPDGAEPRYCGVIPRRAKAAGSTLLGRQRCDCRRTGSVRLANCPFGWFGRRTEVRTSERRVLPPSHSQNIAHRVACGKP